MTIKLELRSIKHAKSLSHETPAYTAAIFLDGKKVGVVENHGHGGPDFAHFSDPSAEAKIAAHFQALPPINSHGFELEQDFELWCHQTIYDLEILKKVRRICSKKIYGVTPDRREITWAIDPARLEESRPMIEKKYPGIRFLNSLTDAEIIASIRD